jgi:hypothetical protein
VKGHDRSWRKLTRGELKTCDDHAKAVVLEAMDKGAVARVGTRGHIMLRNPDTGYTMSVTPNSVKSRHIIRQNLRRLLQPGPTRGTA